MAVTSEHPAAASGPPVEWHAVQRVLAVRLDNLGDVVLCSPALRALRHALPAGARLDLLASPAGAAVGPLLADIDEVVPHRAVWQDATGALPLDPQREVAFAARLAQRGYDAAVVFTSFSQSPWPPAYAAYLAGVPVRVGQSREFGGSVLSHWVTPPPDEAHQVDRALHLLAAVGIPAQGTGLSLAVPDTAAAAARDLLHASGIWGDFAVIAPGASCPSRRYPAERFAAVAGELARQGMPVVVVGSEREGTLVEAVSAGRPGVTALAGRVDVPGLAALVDAAAVAVTNNSGGMHLADALGTPLVALFAGTELEEQYRPRGTVTRLFRVPTTCSPCRAFACPYALECLDIAPADVAAAALELAA